MPEVYTLLSSGVSSQLLVCEVRIHNLWCQLESSVQQLRQNAAQLTQLRHKACWQELASIEATLRCWHEEGTGQGAGGCVAAALGDSSNMQRQYQ